MRKLHTMRCQARQKLERPQGRHRDSYRGKRRGCSNKAVLILSGRRYCAECARKAEII